MFNRKKTENPIVKKNTEFFARDRKRRRIEKIKRVSIKTAKNVAIVTFGIVVIKRLDHIQDLLETEN